jgi:hypothetical protein
MFKDQNKLSLSQLVTGIKITPIFIILLVFWCGLSIYPNTAFVTDLNPYFAMGSGLIYGILIVRKQDMSKKENCCLYKGNLTELLIILHKFGFELVLEGGHYMQLDLKRLFTSPKSIFLILEKKEIRILGDRELIEAMSKDLPKCAVMHNESQTL